MDSASEIASRQTMAKPIDAQTSHSRVSLGIIEIQCGSAAGAVKERASYTYLESNATIKVQKHLLWMPEGANETLSRLGHRG